MIPTEYRAEEHSWRREHVELWLIPVHVSNVRRGDRVRFNGDRVYNYPPVRYGLDRLKPKGFFRRVRRVTRDSTYNTVTLHFGWPRKPHTFLPDEEVFIQIPKGGRGAVLVR